MIPTIDLSNFLSLAALGSFLLKALIFAKHLFNAAISKFTLFINGSKLWATIFFIGLASSLLLLFSSLISYCLTSFFTWIVPPSFSGGLVLRIALQVIPVARITDLLSFTAASSAIIFAAERSSFVANRFYKLFNTGVRAWKI